MRCLPNRASLVAVLSFLTPVVALAADFRLAFIDVGQGDAAVVIAPSGCAAVLDGGPTGSGADIKAYLKSQGVTAVDFVVVSHYHADHMGGIDELDVGTDAVPVARVYDRGGSYSSATYTEYANHYAGKRQTVTRGQRFSLCNEVQFEVVSVNGNGISSTNENAYSVGVKVSYGAFDALVAGDLTAESPNIEQTLVGNVGEVEVYKVHHHGSRYSSSDALLQELKPTVSVISVGLGNTYGHPTPEALARLRAVGSVIYQTEDPATNRILGNVQVSSATGAFYVVAQDGGATSFASKGSGTPGDTTAPSAPANLVATAAGTSGIDLSWSASTDDVGVTAYDVSRSTNGTSFSPLAQVTTTGLADVGLSAGTTYWYQVAARDAAGNVSAVSNTASATTGSVTRTVAVTAPNGGETLAGGSAYTIRWTSSGLTSVRLEASLDDGATWTLIAASVSASTGSYAWTPANTATTRGRVRVSDADTGSPSDLSDGAFTVTSSLPGQVIVNEVLANEPGATTSAEFIELVNVGGQPVSLGGWTLSDDTAIRHRFATGVTLQPGQALVVYGSTASTGDLALNNAGDRVILKNGKKTVDSVTYGAALAGTDGVSMNRSPDATAGAAWVLHTSLSARSSSAGVRPDGTAY